MTTTTTLKGQTRKLRKTLRKLGRTDFPKQGAFHLTFDGVSYDHHALSLDELSSAQYAPGPLPKTEPPKPPRVLHERKVRVGKDKRRVEYRPVKNPVAGQTYFVKEGKRWVETAA